MTFMPNQFVLDAAETVFFARELEFIKRKSYDKKYPSLMARQFVPTSSETPSGAKVVTYEQWDRVGQAKVIANGATDSPRVDVSALQFSRPVRWISDSYGYSVIDIREARYAGKPLDAKKAMAARRAAEELADKIACFGSPVDGIVSGLLNDANVTVNAASGNWLSGGASAADIISDISEMWTDVVDDTEGVEKPDTLVMPDAQYGYLSTTPRSTTTDTTILNFVRENFKMIKNIEPWYRLKGAGAASVDRAMLYRRDPEHVEQEIPNEYEQLPVHQHGLNFTVFTLMATAGTVFYYPKSARYIDGI